MLSRVADSLYWMARYTERAEHVARLIEVNLNLMLDQSSGGDERRWVRLMNAMACPFPNDDRDAARDAFAATTWLAFDDKNDNSIRNCILAARENARQVREQISSEMFEQLNAMYLRVRQTQPTDNWNFQPTEHYRYIRQGCHLLDGIAESTLMHSEEYRFIHLGRAMERAICTARLVSAYVADEVSPGAGSFEAGEYLKWVGLLKSSAAFQAYLECYQGNVRPDRIAEFLVLNATFPRSVRFAVDMMSSSLSAISLYTGQPLAMNVNRLAGRLQSSLSFAQINEIVSGGLMVFLHGVIQQCNEVHHAIYQAYIAYPIEEVAV